MPRTFGRRPIWLSPDSQLQYMLPNWGRASRGLLGAVSRFVKPGDRVWDVGANNGVFTVAAAHLAGPQGRVLAIEADPFLAWGLLRTATHPGNSDRRIDVLCAAAHDSAGVARFMIAARGRASNGLEPSGHRSQAGGTRYIQYVPTTTLDALLEVFGTPSFVKIDVEGAETAVLNGSRSLLQHARPCFYIEVGQDESDGVSRIFSEFRYRLYDGDLQDGRELKSCAFNTLAVPMECPLTNRGWPTA